MWWGEEGFSGGLMTICVGLSLHKRGCQPWFDAPPPKSLLPTYSSSSSFPSRHLPSLVPSHQASSSLCIFFCHSTVSVSMLPWLIGPAPPAGCSSIYPSQSYVHVHSPGKGLSYGGLIAANSGEDKVEWEPIMWTVPSNCRLGSIVGMHYFSQMRWPVSFLVCHQLPNHAHNCLVHCLYQPICLWVVGCSPQSLDTKDLAQFLNDATGKAGISLT